MTDNSPPHSSPADWESLYIGGPKELVISWQSPEGPAAAVAWRLQMNAGGTPALVQQGRLTRLAAHDEIDMLPVYNDKNIRNGSVELRFTVPGHAALWCDIPLTPSSFFQNRLQQWPVAPDPVTDDDEPPPDPFDPAVDNQGHKRLPWGGQIEPADMADFLWLEPSTARPSPGAFIAFADAGGTDARLPLLAGFAGVGAGTPAAAYAAMLAVAGKFVTANWPLAPAAQAKAAALAALITTAAGGQSLEDLRQEAQTLLGMAPDAFLQTEITPPDGLFALVWQLLYAAALLQKAVPPVLAEAALPDTLLLAQAARAMALVIRLVQGDAALCDAATRVRLGNALLVLPDAVLPPAPASAGAVECLGVGAQKTISQRLKTYIAGEIAETINLMPGEEVRWRDRNRSKDISRAQHHNDDRQGEVNGEHSGSSSDLAQSLRDALTQTELNRDYTKLAITPGTWPELVADGSWWGWDGGQARQIGLATNFVQTLSRQAVKRMTARVAQLRASATLRERETVLARAIDNRRAAKPLRGAYHWLEKLYELRMRSKGRHLVLEFLFDAPGARLRAQATAWPGLAPVLPPEHWGISSAPADYTTVTPETYANAGAAYGLVLAPPPPARLMVYAVLGGPGQSAKLVIPPGYAATAISLSYSISNAGLPLTAIVGDMPVSFTPAPTPPSLSSLPASLPAAAFPSGPPAIPDPQAYGPAQPQAGGGTGSVTLTTPLTGEIPIACQYGGTGVSLVALAQCASHSDTALTSWQITTHQAILAGYDDARTAHEAALLDALAKLQAHEGVGRLISRQLTLSGLDALAAALPQPEAAPAPLTAEQQRFFTDAIDWQNATYAFFPFGTDTGAASGTGAVHRASPLRWTGETVTDRDDPAWMRSFMQAGSARMLATVRHGYEVPLLFLLAYGHLPAGPGAIFTTAQGRPWLAQLREAPLPQGETCWELQVPTDHAVLIVDETFPAGPKA